MIYAYYFIYLGENITFEIIDAAGRPEKGEGVGVIRDILATTWQDILDSLCVGQAERVPFVRHDLYMEEWKSIGKLLRYGYEKVGFFPTQLSKAFVMICLFESVPNEILIDSFLNYIPSMDHEMVNSALQADFDTIRSDEFLDFLDRFNCRSHVTPLNVYGIILELSQQELVQKPYLMVSVWREVLSGMKTYEDFSSVCNIKKFYNKVQPTNRKVLQLLKAEPISDAERESYKFLQEYVRGLDKKELKVFLKFVTGSFIIIVKNIQVSFNNLQGAQRRPFVRTCTPMIELPATYRNFCELREEFSNILKSSQWEFDTA